MKKLEPVECPYSDKLSPMEMMNEVRNSVYSHIASSEENISRLNLDASKECCTLYSDSYFGYGFDRFVYLDKECTIAPSFEQLLNICQTYRNIVVKNGTRCYHVQGYEVNEFNPYNNEVVNKKLSLLFSWGFFEYPCETGTKETDGVTYPVIQMHQFYGVSQMSVYQDENGDTYYHAIRYAYDGEPEELVYPREGALTAPTNHSVHVLLYNVKA